MMRGRLGRLLPYLGIVISVCMMLYYPGTEMVDAWRRQQVAERLDVQSSGMDPARKDMLLAQAKAYNQLLAGETPDIDAGEILPYADQLNYYGTTDAFGYLLIPKIGLAMPVYHGLSEAVLQVGSGHSDASSLPVGGDTAHSVLSGHSGMPDMRAFDDIRELAEGDVFGIKVLGDVYCYRVTSTETVAPDDMSSLGMQRGRDLCTLVTCTPYGVNSKRLLVHAERCETPDGFGESVPGPAESLRSPRVVPALLAILLLSVVVAVTCARRAKAKGARGPCGGGRHEERSKDYKRGDGCNERHQHEGIGDGRGAGRHPGGNRRGRPANRVRGTDTGGDADGHEGGQGKVQGLPGAVGGFRHP